MADEKAYVTSTGPYNAEYEHLEKIMNRVISEKPKDAYGLVEVLSRLVREQPDKSTPASTEDLETAANYVQQVRVLDKVPAEDGNPISVCAVPDFCEEADILQWVGIGFGEMESYKIKCSLRNLAAKRAEDGFEKIRLWGKILGTDADYYIAEASKAETGELGEGDPEDMEPPGVGANKNTYFVTNDLTEDWYKLPNITPSQIVQSRRIKKLMTGKVSSKVITHPPFHGTEEVLLRCQIARIAADTTLMFKDRWKREGVFGEEDAGEPALNEEDFKVPSVSQLMTPEGWQHLEPHILQNGRTTHRDPPEEDEENPEQNKVRKKMLDEQESDPVRDPIRQLAGDGLEWAFKQYGDTSVYRSTAIDADSGKTLIIPKSNAITCVRSLTWPGCVTVAQKETMVNLYVGYGLPAKEPDFSPHGIPDVQDEPDDVEEQPEPNGVPQSDEPPPDDA